MSKSIIKEIFCYRRVWDCVPLSKRGELLRDIASAKSKQFSAKLSKELNKEFEDYCDAELQYNIEYTDQNFVEGFKMGMLFGVECGKVFPEGEERKEGNTI